MSFNEVKGEHPLKEIIRENKSGMPVGICSICSANEIVIEAAMDKAAESGNLVLIEATANQVNQFGGYTGMRPADFSRFVFKIAERARFAKERIILGGDHLGPLTWNQEPADLAMEKAVELVREFVLAGFTKIHLDTSMKLGDDAAVMLSTDVIAARSARLAAAAEDAFIERLSLLPDSLHPVYVIGSEVPIPGGSHEDEGIQVTSAKDFEETLKIFNKIYATSGLENAWRNVIACVVQPGVEFGDETIHEYNRQGAATLTGALKKYPELVFEGHSTDYQTASGLHAMLEDGIAILKVGPALTFALREGFFALNRIENELFHGRIEVVQSDFTDVLEEVMLEKPEHWMKHYHGDAERLRLARKYSLSDRCRYYLTDMRVKRAIDKLLENFNGVQIPLTLLSQYLPVQYCKIREGRLKNEPVSILKDKVGEIIGDYLPM